MKFKLMKRIKLHINFCKIMLSKRDPQKLFYKHINNKVMFLVYSYSLKKKIM